MQIQVSLTVELNATLTLKQMEEQVQEAGHRWMRQALKEGVRHWEEAHRRCPRCGGQVRPEGTVARKILTLFGPVELARRRFRCQQCQQRHCPSKSLLAGLHATQVTQPLREAALMGGASWPYRHAAGWLKRLTGAQISAEAIRLLTNEEGKRAAKRQKEQATSSPPLPPAQPQEPAAEERAVIGLDGGWVCSREKRGGMEGKVGVIASEQEWGKEPEQASSEMTWMQLSRYVQTHRHPPRRRSRWNRRRYVATFADAATFGLQAAHALQELGLQQHPAVVVADGAHWIKKETAKHFPQAQPILDWPHLWRTVRKAARAVGGLTHRSQEEHAGLVRQLETWLWKGEVEQAQALLKQWRSELAGQPAHRLAPLRQAITYLEKQRSWMGNYAQWKQQGYPVGSGIIERAVSLVINRRMKRRGMRWLRKNATAVVALRVDLLNADWSAPASSRCFP